MLLYRFGHVYSYLIDCRLNIFCAGEQWAIVAERLGYNPRAGRIVLELYYFGNCLTRLEHYNGHDTNCYMVYPVEDDPFFETLDGESLKPDARFWRIRGQEIELSRRKEDYFAAGIDLIEYEPGEILVEEVGRLLVTKHRDLFRATDQELYKSLPENLKKLLVLDEWYHRDFTEVLQVALSDEQLRSVYELNRKFPKNQPFMDAEQFVKLYRAQEQSNQSYNEGQWNDNRPSAYETWRLLAKVIATGDPSLYQPSLLPNTHWKFWPDSGSL